ncbi:MAG: M23 family metallopeptidase [Rubellimicrobium sp.]|nr:M23 family metallopeptidase [Rubellimicrobium sp.]
MSVDPAFHQARQRSLKRQRLRRLRTGAVAGGGLVVAALTGWLLLGDRAPGPADDGIADATTLAPGADEGLDQMTQLEIDATAAPIRSASAFVDIPGDPLILRLDGGDTASNRRSMAGPPTLDTARVGPPAPDRLVLITDELVVQDRRLIAALPSSREDFAFFQAQRAQVYQPTVPDAFPEGPVDGEGPRSETGTVQGEQIIVTEAASFGELLQTSSDATPASFNATLIENNTSLAFVRPEAQRRAIYEDLIIRIEAARDLTETLTSNGLSEETALSLAEGAAALMELPEDLPPGSIVALRLRPAVGDGDIVPLQMSIYDDRAYVGTAAMQAPGIYVLGSDPWIGKDLRSLGASEQAEVLSAGQDFRLIDAVYSAAMRNDMPATLVGEAIVMLSQAHDLESFAAPGDRLRLLYAPQPGPEGAGPGQILFVGISGPSGDKPCYVIPTTDAAGRVDHACASRTGAAARPGQLGGGFVTPVQGTLSSPFGPRFHPILRDVRLHAGVDWAAPTGTPIVAAGAGTIRVMGDGGGYGNVIYIDHPNGYQTRYAHMDAFAAGMSVGRAVQAGELIGYVGTTGRSTGPHLHFEVRLGDQAVDPFSLGPARPGGGGGSAPAPGGGITASAAVEALTDQIIRVESGGRADARNPLSTATGLGQFIESTWLRMMRDYRPELAASMSRADLLALRTDPTLSREMVQNLARENENFLRARGHEITAGRLYLAHFLGPAGANTALSADDGQSVLEVMGSAVVNANPFLRGYTIADLKAWADRKMEGTGRSPAPAAPAAAPLSAEARAYIEVIDEVLQDTG